MHLNSPLRTRWAWRSPPRLMTATSPACTRCWTTTTTSPACGSPAAVAAAAPGARSLLHVVTDWPGRRPSGAVLVRMLVAAGADVNAAFRGDHRETPLHWAASSDDVDVIDALVEAGADLNAPGAVIAELIAEGDKVVGRFMCSATHTGTWLGHPATGRRFENPSSACATEVSRRCSRWRTRWHAWSNSASSQPSRPASPTPNGSPGPSVVTLPDPRQSAASAPRPDACDEKSGAWGVIWSAAGCYDRRCVPSSPGAIRRRLTTMGRYARTNCVVDASSRAHARSRERGSAVPPSGGLCCVVTRRCAKLARADRSGTVPGGSHGRPWFG